MSSPENIKAEKDLRLSRSYAAKHLPWFAPALFRCRIVISSLVPVAAIDINYNTYWNPGAVNLIVASTTDRKRSLEELSFIWIHEICHVLREHSERAQKTNRIPLLWNYAADLEINDSTWPGTKHPTLFPPIFAKQFQLPDGKLAEWYYKNLQVNESSTYSWDDGSGAHGEARPWQVHDTQKQAIPKIGKIIIQRDVARKMKKHLMGNIPGGWKMWINNILEPKVDWRQILKKRLSTAISIGGGSRVDYTYRKPNRRASILKPIILPSLQGNLHSQLTVVIDTSGSMTGAPIEQAIGEIYGILRQVHQRVNLLPCDAKGYKPILLRRKEDLKRLVELPGGGGTNMILGIEAALSLKPKPDTILVLTDGYTPYPMVKYSIPVIWGIIGHSNLHNPPFPPNPPWGSDIVIFIDLDK